LLDPLNEQIPEQELFESANIDNNLLGDSSDVVEEMSSLNALEECSADEDDILQE
jgi:hypothetical protein